MYLYIFCSFFADLSKNGNLLSMIKKKYNLNHPMPTTTTPKLTDMWKKKQTNVTSSKTPLKTNNSSSPFLTKSPPLKSKNIKIPSSSLSNAGITLGTNDNHYSFNSILGQLHKENMQRRHQLTEKNDHSMIGHEIKSKQDENRTENKTIYIDLTESPSVSSKNNRNSSSFSKKPNSLVKQVIQNSDQKSLSKVPQSPVRDFGKVLNDRNLYDSQRSFLSNKVGFIEKNMESSFKSYNKEEKSNFSFSSISPEKYSSGFSPTSKSPHQEKKSKSSTSSNLSSGISEQLSSPESNTKHSLLTKKDTATSLLLLKKKRKRLLGDLIDSSPDKQTFSLLKSEKQSRPTSSNISSRLNPDFFSSSSYKEKKPLFSNSSSTVEKSFSSNNSEKQTSLSSSDSSSSLNKESKPLIKNLNTSLSNLSKERKQSTTDSSSSSLLDGDRKYSPTNISFLINEERKTIQSNTSSSHLSNHKEKLNINSSSSENPIKRHCLTDSSPSHSPFKQKKVSQTESNSSSKNLSSLTPKKKYSFKKLHSSPHSDKSKRKENLTSVASSPNEQQTPNKKEKLFAQLFGDDSDSEVETDKNPVQILKYPNSSSSSPFISQNTKSPQKSTSGSKFKKSTSTQIQSNCLENYFTTPVKESSEDDPVIIDDYTASSGRISQSNVPQNMVPCPVCQKKVPEAKINDHLDECLNMNLINENT